MASLSGRHWSGKSRFGVENLNSMSEGVIWLTGASLRTLQRTSKYPGMILTNPTNLQHGEFIINDDTVKAVLVRNNVDELISSFMVYIQKLKLHTAFYEAMYLIS